VSHLPLKVENKHLLNFPLYAAEMDSSMQRSKKVPSKIAKYRRKTKKENLLVQHSKTGNQQSYF